MQRTGSSKEMTWYILIYMIVRDCHDEDVQITASTWVSDPIAANARRKHCKIPIRVAGTELAARLPWFGGAFTRRTAPSNIARNARHEEQWSSISAVSQVSWVSHPAWHFSWLCLHETTVGSVGSQRIRKKPGAQDKLNYTRILESVFGTGIRTLLQDIITNI